MPVLVPVRVTVPDGVKVADRDVVPVGVGRFEGVGCADSHTLTVAEAVTVKVPETLPVPVAVDVEVGVRVSLAVTLDVTLPLLLPEDVPVPVTDEVIV